LARPKNGNEFVTSRYWPEGRQILFDTYGGVFDIDKAFVTKIKASDKPLTPLATILAEPEVKRPSAPIKAQEERKQAPVSKPQESEVNRANDPIVHEFSALKENFKGLEGTLTSELQELSADLMNLKRKLRWPGPALFGYLRWRGRCLKRYCVRATIQSSQRKRSGLPQLDC
jgi:hypothetical protein